jgi:hypothetical protein
VILATGTGEAKRACALKPVANGCQKQPISHPLLAIVNYWLEKSEELKTLYSCVFCWVFKRIKPQP